MSQSSPKQGLFAFKGADFHVYFQDSPELDHAEWFNRIGLPSHGPDYDAILRGKVTFDADTDRFRLGFYGTAYLSEPRYNKIVETFQLDPGRVVEKRLMEVI